MRLQRRQRFNGNTSPTVVGAYTGRDLTMFGTGNVKVSTLSYHVCAITATGGVSAGVQA